MDNDTQILRRVYDGFNKRDIEAVLALLADDVVWANGMDGGHVRGIEAVRAYWTHQWTVVSPHVEPTAFDRADDGAIVVRVRQSIRDLEGKAIEGQAHGLRDRTVEHVFHLISGRVTRFDIRDAS